ncbi:unnamed protein product [Staurois parvus]|uniref:Uncharacterized protein n=1 Tax=Staurois parvus TaxID=386267 RepID=A0ABN9E735_9NEOB|nr:unnamed protein product [Staurois parvus]
MYPAYHQTNSREDPLISRLAHVGKENTRHSAVSSNKFIVKQITLTMSK